MEFSQSDPEYFESEPEIFLKIMSTVVINFMSLNSEIAAS